jgi:lysophospholipase L1-like esterase
MLIASHTRLLFIGDSITDAGRARPVGEQPKDRLGNGFVHQVATLLGANYPQRQIRVINMGQSGDTVRMLKARWQSDALDLQPDWLVLMIGINDVWRQFDRPTHPECAVPLDEYVRILEDLVTSTKPRLRGLVLMTPFHIEPSTTEPMRRRMDEYGRAVLALAQRTGCIGVDVQAAFDRMLRHVHSSRLAWDRIHPDAVGHMVITRAFLDAIGFEWLPPAGQTV